jgi:hypothetical protein
MVANLGFTGIQGGGAAPSTQPAIQYKDAFGTPISQDQAARTANFQSGGSLYQQALAEEKAMRDGVAAMRAQMEGGGTYAAPQTGGIDPNPNQLTHGVTPMLNPGGFAGVQTGGPDPFPSQRTGGPDPFPWGQNTQQTVQNGSAAGGGNPYLQQQADAITNQVNQNWTRVQQPSIRSGAMAAGGFGGSRQGVVEANALNDINQGLSNSLANLYGTDWTNAQNRGLQQQQISNSYNLGLGNLALGNDTLDANIYNRNFDNQMASANFGLNAYNTMMGYGQQGINNATTVQNTPLQYQQYFNSAYNAGGGQGGTTTGVQGTTSNPWMAGSTIVRALGY